MFGIVHEQVVRIWQGLSKEAIESAWRIPGLNLGSTPPQSNDAEQSDLDFSDSEILSNQIHSDKVKQRKGTAL